jgi:PAP2 superfamily.
MNPRFGTASLAVLVSAILFSAALAPLDPALSAAARALPPSLVAASAAITDFGTFSWMIYGSALVAVLGLAVSRLATDPVLAVRATRVMRLAVYFLLSTGAASALVHLLKALVGRARPELIAELGAYSLTPLTGDVLFESFPSGHSAAAGAFFGAMALLLPRYAVLFLLGALTIGVTRVVVGAHYPSDVAAGLHLGGWAALAAATLLARAGWLFRLDGGVRPRPRET